jgi:tRNA nucleotidyltransferase (CCA-adding enzyme)
VTEREHLVLSPPAAVLEIVLQLESSGFEAWCVGGAVRDAILGHLHLDWDIATSARPDQVRRVFRRTVPIGIDFGTIGVLDSGGIMHEVTTFRKDVETDGRHARVVFGASLEEDLARRDFTINALAWSPSRTELFDPFDGRGDLKRGLVRTVGDADDRMAEDRLRALRALRFAARFGFEIESDTWGAIVRSAPFMNRLSPERVRQEVEKTMDQVKLPGQAFRLWRDSGAFERLVPALGRISDLELTYADQLPLPGLAGRPARRNNRMTALFLATGGSGARAALRALRFSNSDIAWIAGQVERWKSAAPVLERGMEGDVLPPPAFLRRWISKVGRMRAPPLLRVMIAVWRARSVAGLDAPRQEVICSLYSRMIRSAFRDPVELSDLKVDGDDLRAAGVPPGPGLGRLLATLLTRVLEQPELNQRETLLQIAIGMREIRGQAGQSDNESPGPDPT